ncbi:hypothetical protein ERJ75_001704400 [Trypanosoma vivax]|nr:hypothetical protein ERJ75_001704400 [Trypanosoma vivax]
MNTAFKLTKLFGMCLRTSPQESQSSQDVCNANLVSQSLRLLSSMTDHSAVMSSLEVVAQLKRLTDSIKERALKARKLIQVATASSS